MSKFDELVEIAINKGIMGYTENIKIKILEAIKDLKKIRLQYLYEDKDLETKMRLLRNLAVMLKIVGKKAEAEQYVLELFDISNMENIKEWYPLEYCKARNCYSQYFKERLDRQILINIEKENMEMYKKLESFEGEFFPDFLTAKINIYFLMEDYNSVVNTLLEIHTNESSRIVDLKKSTISELASASSEHYNKYLKVINMANSLIS